MFPSDLGGAALFAILAQLAGDLSISFSLPSLLGLFGQAPRSRQVFTFLRSFGLPSFNLDRTDSPPVTFPW